MEKKFVIPAVTFLACVFLWVAFLVFHEAGSGIRDSLLINVGLCSAAGGLIAFSAARCRRADGPRMGSIIRSSVLIVMTATTYWRVDAVTACVLMIATVMVGVMVLMKTYQSEVTKDSVSA